MNLAIDCVIGAKANILWIIGRRNLWNFGLLGRFLEGMDDPKDEFDQLHPIKMLFLNALVSEGRPTETRHMPIWWNLEFTVKMGKNVKVRTKWTISTDDFQVPPRLLSRCVDKI